MKQDSKAAKEAAKNSLDLSVDMTSEDPIDNPAEDPKIDVTPEAIVPPIVDPAPPAQPEIPIVHKPLVVKATGDFTVSIGNSTRSYKQGAIESDYNTVKYLMESGCPVAPLGEDDITQCPSCKHIFKRG